MFHDCQWWIVYDMLITYMLAYMCFFPQFNNLGTWTTEQPIARIPGARALPWSSLRPLRRLYQAFEATLPSVPSSSVVCREAAQAALEVPVTTWVLKDHFFLLGWWWYVGLCTYYYSIISYYINVIWVFLYIHKIYLQNSDGLKPKLTV